MSSMQCNILKVHPHCTHVSIFHSLYGWKAFIPWTGCFLFIHSWVDGHHFHPAAAIHAQVFMQPQVFISPKHCWVSPGSKAWPVEFKSTLCPLLAPAAAAFMFFFLKMSIQLWTHGLWKCLKVCTVNSTRWYVDESLSNSTLTLGVGEWFCALWVLGSLPGLSPLPTIVVITRTVSGRKCRIIPNWDHFASSTWHFPPFASETCNLVTWNTLVHSVTPFCSHLPLGF